MYELGHYHAIDKHIEILSLEAFSGNILVIKYHITVPSPNDTFVFDIGTCRMAKPSHEKDVA